MGSVETATREQLLRAARLVLGPERTPEVGEGLRLSELRQAFRRRALETHPDRAALLGRPEPELAAEYNALAEAYRLLEAHAARRVRLNTKPAPAPRDGAAPAPSSDHYAGSPVPRRPLRLAEWLYYSGAVSWRSAVEAVTWQRRQRPPLGRLATDWGWLAAGEVALLLAGRRRDGRPGEPLGEYAVRKGRLTRAQLLALLGRQRRLQRRIGTYFVESGILREEEIAAACGTLLAHNARCR